MIVAVVVWPDESVASRTAMPVALNGRMGNGAPLSARVVPTVPGWLDEGPKVATSGCALNSPSNFRVQSDDTDTGM